MDITDVFGNYVMRDQRKDNAYHNKSYTSHEFDDVTGNLYVHARYLGAPTHSFLSADPVIYNLDSSNSLDRQRFAGILINPQLQNSYAYAGNNPVVNFDKDGKYVEVSLSTVIPGRSFSAGIRIDENGIDYFLGGGVGYGLSGGATIGWAPGQSLSHQNGSSISLNGSAGDGLFGQFSQNIYSYSPQTKGSVPNGAPTFSAGIGGGYSGSVQQEVSAPAPYLVWGNTSGSQSTQRIVPATIGMPTTQNSSKTATPKVNAGPQQQSVIKSPAASMSPSLPSTSSQSASKGIINTIINGILKIFK